MPIAPLKSPNCDLSFAYADVKALRVTRHGLAELKPDKICDWSTYGELKCQYLYYFSSKCYITQVSRNISMKARLILGCFVFFIL